MKKIITIVLLGVNLFGFSQTTHLKNQPTILTENSKWNLDKNIWSRTHSFGNRDKPNFDFDAIDNFVQLTDKLSVSPNGNYFAYGTFKGTPDLKKQETLIIQSTNDSWQKSFLNGKDGFFSADSKLYVFKSDEDLCFLNLSSDNFRTVKKVSSYRQSAEQASWVAYQLMDDKSTVIIENLLSGKTIKIENVASYEFDKTGQWLACQLKTEGKELVLYNLSSGAEKRFPSVESYAFSNDSESLISKSVINQDKDSKIEIQYITLSDGKINTVWASPVKSASVISYSLNNTGKQVVLTIKGNTGNNTENTIWYYKAGMDKAVLKVNSQTDGMDGFVIEGPATFTDNSSYIQFSLKSASANLKQAAESESVQVKIWNHKDLFLQSVKQSNGQIVKTYKAVINPEAGKVICVDKEFKGDSYLIGDYAIINKLQRRQTDRFWEKNKLDSTWLINLKDGSRRLLLASTNGDRDQLWFSPGGNYVIYFDGDSGSHFYGLDLHTRAAYKISENVLDGQLAYSPVYVRAFDKNLAGSCGIAAWLKDDKGVLIYDNNDIWLLDLSGKNRAVNVTNGYGASSGIVFSLMNSDRSSISPPIVDSHESLLLRAFDTRTKFNGYYRKTIGVTGSPQLLFTGSCFMENVAGYHGDLSNSGIHAVKAKDVDIWIVQRQSSEDAPNYFLTTHFKDFKRLTDYQPQKGYNWLTEELHTFKHLDGLSGQGILYKPENFDPTKKYPVLIICYGAYSNSLHQFHVPQYNQRAITPGESPVWFLNNGYLVFTPDIYVAPGKFGPEAFNVIEGAAKYLKELPFVDSNALGVCSHSWSAKLGAYVFTHSKSFAAIAITEGFIYANMIGIAFSAEERTGTSELNGVENGFGPGNLWKNKGDWFDQTTILNVDMATSPLLLLCNQRSSKEYQDQTLQLFTALRRLDKKAWWLQYAKGGHNLEDIDEEKDYTIRYTQYFDHYLKNAPAPRWMTRSDSPNNGIDYAFKLDPSGNCSSEKKSCAICEAWNKQYKRNPAIFEREIKDWVLDKDIAEELNNKQREERKRLDKEGVIETKKVLDILKNGYPGNAKK